MKITVVSEVSTAARNRDVVSALEGRGHEILNLGMKDAGEDRELTIVHTGLLAALALNGGIADLVVGGCGTGQGFAISVSQYPGVVCGHISTPLDAWIFPQINAGNCISLALNQGYGWGADVNLRLVFDALFSVEKGHGYPPHREEPQRGIRTALLEVAERSHRTMNEIVRVPPRYRGRPGPGVSGCVERAPRRQRLGSAGSTGVQRAAGDCVTQRVAWTLDRSGHPWRSDPCEPASATAAT